MELKLHIDAFEVLEKLDALRIQGEEIMATVAQIKTQVDDLKARVMAETTIVQSAKTLLEGLSAIIAALRQQLADAIANGANPAELQAVLDSVDAAKAEQDAQAAALAAAISANTPSA